MCLEYRKTEWKQKSFVVIGLGKGMVQEMERCCCYPCLWDRCRLCSLTYLLPSHSDGASKSPKAQRMTSCRHQQYLRPGIPCGLKELKELEEKNDWGPKEIIVVGKGFHCNMKHIYCRSGVWDCSVFPFLDTMWLGIPLEHRAAPKNPSLYSPDVSSPWLLWHSTNVTRILLGICREPEMIA